MQIYDLQRRTWAEIDLDAAAYNYQLIRKAIPKQTRICCVVKANGYGHGAVPLSLLYEKLGADQFAVSNIEEAIQLRRGGIKGGILILGYTPANCVTILSRYRIAQCVYSQEYARLLSDAAVRTGCKVLAHIKLDTGMGRIGFRCLSDSPHTVSELCDEVESVCKFPYIDAEGIFMHFAVADEGEKGEIYTRKQFSYFQSAIRELDRRGIHFRVRHCANSAALLDYSEFCIDMVRAGVILYGLSPSSGIRTKLNFRPVMTLRSVISHTKMIREGDFISYGCTFRAERDMRIATVPIGYADGFWRSYGEYRVQLTVRGVRVPIIGRICMDQLMADISNVPECKIDDEVTIFGTFPAMTADEIARQSHTIGYEVICGIGERVPRLYYRNGELQFVRDNLLDFA